MVDEDFRGEGYVEMRVVEVFVVSMMPCVPNAPLLNLPPLSWGTIRTHSPSVRKVVKTRTAAERYRE